VCDVELPPREEVVDRHDFVAVFEEAFAEMGTEEAGTAGDENAHGKNGLRSLCALRAAWKKVATG
jgi:hypothetical protein